MPVPLGSDSAAVWPKNLPSNCVENFKFIPSSAKRIERIKPKRWNVDKQPVDMWKLTMCLRSGLLAESSWALDTLAIYLADEVNTASSAFQLSRLPRTLFDCIVEWLAVLLYNAFPQEFTGCMQSLKHSMLQFTMGSGSPSSVATTPSAGLNKLPTSLKTPTTVAFNGTWHSAVRAGESNKRVRLPDGLPSKFDVNESSGKRPRLHFEAVDNMNDYDYFLLDEDPVPDVMRHYRPFVRTHHSCTRTRSLELFCGSEKTRAVSVNNSSRKSSDDANLVRNGERNATKSRRPVEDAEPAAVVDGSQSPDSGAALSPADQQMSANEDDDSNPGIIPTNHGSSSTRPIQPGRNSVPLANSSNAKPRVDCEAENFGDPVFNLGTTSEAELHQRLLVVIVILRNLSFMPSNEAVMARNATLLRFLGRLLLLRHTHSERRPLLTSPKTDAEWAREVQHEQRSHLEPIAQENDRDREHSATTALVAQLREHALVIFSNCAGYMELIQLPEDVAEAVVHGLLYWSSTQCTAGDEPFAVNDIT